MIRSAGGVASRRRRTPDARRPSGRRTSRRSRPAQAPRRPPARRSRPPRRRCPRLRSRPAWPDRPSAGTAARTPRPAGAPPRAGCCAPVQGPGPPAGGLVGVAGVARQQLPDRIDRGVVEGLRVGAGGAHLTLDRIERVGLREHRGRRLRDRLADAADRAGDAAEDAANQAAGRGGQQIEDQERGECPGRQAVEGAGRRHGAAGHPRGDVAAGERGDDARTNHQTAAVIEKVDAAGLSPLAGSSVAIPIPAPSIVSRTWTTSATTTPAKIAPTRPG